MNSTHESPWRSPASCWRKRLLAMLLIAGVDSFVWSELPDGAYPTDLSQIGSGRPALVLAHDSNYTGGMAVIDLMNEIRHDSVKR